MNLVFDVDGTLIDSREDIASAQEWVLRRMGVTAYSKKDLYPHIGKPLTETFAHLLPAEMHHRIPEAKRMYIAHYRPRALDTTTLFPGVEPTLARLHEAGIGMAVATTKSTVTATRVLNHFGIIHHFKQIQGTDDTPPKPDPYVINRVLEQLKWEKEETILVGDSEADVSCARNAGIRVCAVTYGALDRDAAERLRPDFEIHTFPEVEKLVPSNARPHMSNDQNRP